MVQHGYFQTTAHYNVSKTRCCQLYALDDLVIIYTRCSVVFDFFLFQFKCKTYMPTNIINLSSRYHPD